MMKSIFILLAVIIATSTVALGQDEESALNKEELQDIQKIINTFKTKNKAKIADLISYPLKRVYPLKDVQNKNDFIKRFDDIFDKQFLDKVIKSKISDWSGGGWRGIMFDNGAFWIAEGEIYSINYQAPKEEQLFAKAIQAEKNQLPASLQNSLGPIYLIFTKNYKIRIDYANEAYRYAAWKIKNPKFEPDVIIENGVREFEGSGGNQTITFKNNGYTYILSIIEIGTADDPDAILEVFKQEKSILTEKGTIKRN